MCGQFKKCPLKSASEEALVFINYPITRQQTVALPLDVDSI